MYKPILLTILIALAVVSGWLAFRGEAEMKEYVSLEELFLRAPNAYLPTTYILGTLVSEELYEIIRCESGFDPTICNREFGCGSGQGLAQIIPSTLRHCEKKLGKKLEVFNPQDNLECAQYLLEEEGDYHWEMSKECWG